jgi:hypothetical protein
VAWLLAAAPAVADGEAHGGIAAQALVDFDQRYGAALVADALWQLGPVRLGGSFAVGALSNSDQRDSNVLSAIGPALWWGAPGVGGPYGILRLGATLGAANGSFDPGVWGAPGLGYAFGLGGEAVLQLELQGWVIHDGELALAVAPGIGLGW